MSASHARGRGAEIAWSLVQLFGLVGIAVAQPLFDLLRRTPEFFPARQSRSIDVFLLVAVVCVVLPLVLVAIEGVTLLVGQNVRKFVHTLFVSLAASLVAMRVLRISGATSFPAYIAVSLVAGVAAGVGYLRSTAARSFVTVLGCVAIVFPAWFLASPAIRAVAFEQRHAVRGTNVGHDAAPVVLVVFDELGTAALMDSRREIDSVRYPNFARLAEHATWFRNATSVSDDTTYAVPAIVTGRFPSGRRPPTSGGYPDNLFTLLGGTYRLEVFETWTMLCPAELCRGRPTVPPHGRMGMLLADLTVVYAHLVAPPDLARDLPPVTSRWKNFSDTDSRDDTSEAREAQDPAGQFDAFISTIEPRSEPTLYFAHVSLPHVPWQYLPTGARYGPLDNWSLPHGALRDRWGPDEWEAIQGRQRYLFQVGFVDRLLGRLLDRLEATRLYDRAVIVVVADHGTAFHVNDQRRSLTDTNAADIAWVPLLIRTPRQGDGAISDLPVRTIDILPSIADAAQFTIPWHIDGRSAFDTHRPSSVDAKLFTGGSPAGTAPPRREDFDRMLARQLDVFGSRTGWERVFRIGPHPEFVGVAAGAGPVHSPCTAEIDGRELFQTVRRASSFVPAHVKGSISGGDACRDLQLAVAVNGTVRATTRTFSEGAATKFTAMVPETSFRDGSNDVQLFMFAKPERGERLALRAIPTTGLEAYALVESGGRPVVLRTSRDRAVEIDSTSVDGFVDEIDISYRTLGISGWAVDRTTREPAAEVVVFVDGRFQQSARTNVERPDLSSGATAGVPSGFQYRLSLAIDALEPWRVRVFAISKSGRASELSRFRRYRLTTSPDGSRRLVRIWDGTAVPIVADAVAGRLETAGFHDNRGVFTGWASDGGKAPPEVVIFVDDQFLAAGRPSADPRPQRTSGARFHFDVYTEIDAGDPLVVRAFGLSERGVASELARP